MLSFYLTGSHPSTSQCDIDSNVKYTLNSYILFSIVVIFISCLSQILSNYYLKNYIVVNVIIFTLFYSLIIIIALGGIFIAQQMNSEHTCYQFFMDNKNVFSIFISILFLALVNIIYKCIECKNEQVLNNYNNDDEYRRLISSI